MRNRAWVKRLTNLESILQTRTSRPPMFRYGRLLRLSHLSPKDGCIVIHYREATELPHVEQCEFDQQIGPAPQDDRRAFHVFLDLEDNHESAA